MAKREKKTRRAVCGREVKATHGYGAAQSIKIAPRHHDTNGAWCAGSSRAVAR